MPAREIDLRYDATPSALSYMLRGALPVPRRIDLSPPIAARWSGHRPDRQQLGRFLELTGLPAGATLPLLYPHTFGFRLAMAVLTHPAFPVPIWGVLQIRNHLRQHRPIPVDAALDFEARFEGGRALDKGAELDLHTTVHVSGALAWESTVTFLARGRFGAAGAPSPLTRSPSDLGPELARWTMRDEGHLRFGAFTGDYNGIHTWDWYARRFGFRQALYHPPRVLGECLARLPAIDPAAPQRLDAWLKGPVPHGAPVRLHAQPEGDATTFALFADGRGDRGQDRPRVVGRWSCTVKGPPWNDSKI
ncbi:MAG: acyl dehydratase [Deltaproteobacteria bacterium]|nr:acyl dehydratase [Deltaproteobacteria bacterium]